MISSLSLLSILSLHLYSGYWDTSNWKDSWPIWPWPNLSRSSEKQQVIHYSIISLCDQSQFCIFNGSWDMANWKIPKPIRPWLNFSRPPETWQVINNDIISVCYKFQVCILAVSEVLPTEKFEGQFDLDLISQDHWK